MNKSCENTIEDKSLINKIISREFLINSLVVFIGGFIGFAYCVIFETNFSNLTPSIMIGAFISFFIKKRPCKVC